MSHLHVLGHRTCSRLGRYGRRGTRLIGLASLLIGSCFIAAPGSAVALVGDPAPSWFETHSEAEQQQMLDWAYRGGPQDVVPYSGDPASRAAAAWAEEQVAASHEYPLFGDFAKQTVEARIKTGLLAEIADAPAIPLTAAVAGSFSAGWLIGTGIRKYFRIGLPPPPAQVDQFAGKTFKLDHYNPSDELFWLNGFFGARMYVPVPARVLVETGTNQFFVRRNGGGCNQPWSMADGFIPLLNAAAAECNDAIWPATHGTAIDYIAFYRPDTQFSPVSVVKDFDPATDPVDVSTPGLPAPDAAAARPKLAAQLDSAGQDAVRAWLDWLADGKPGPNPLSGDALLPNCISSGTETFTSCGAKLERRGFRGRHQVVVDNATANYGQAPDTVVSTTPAAGGTAPWRTTDVAVQVNPTANEMAPLDDNDDEPCRLSTPKFADPYPSRGTNLNPLQYEISQTFAITGGSVRLRYGWTKPIPAPKLWAGWGLRHIWAKHGWGSKDVSATAAALKTTPDPQGTTNVYTGAPYNGKTKGTKCARTVVVQTEKLGTELAWNAQHPGSAPLGPREIITSYGRKL